MIQSFNLNSKNVAEICKYATIDHSLVHICMNHLDVYEMNLLFGIYSLLGTGMTDISLSESAVRELAKPSNTMRITKNQAHDIAKSLIEKMRGNGDQDYNSLFDVFQVDYEDEERNVFDGMRIKIWEDNKDLFCKNGHNPYTLVKLNEFKTLRSVQLKIFYLLLAQWRTIGRVRYREEELIGILGTANKQQLKVMIDNMVVRMRDCFKSLCVDTKQRVGQHGKHLDKVYVFTFFKKKKQKKRFQDEKQSEKVSD